MSIPFPQPDQRILARREAIVEGLRPLVAPEALIVTEDERRAFETDALTAYRRLPLGVALPPAGPELARRSAVSLTGGKWGWLARHRDAKNFIQFFTVIVAIHGGRRTRTGRSRSC